MCFWKAMGLRGILIASDGFFSFDMVYLDCALLEMMA